MTDDHLAEAGRTPARDGSSARHGQVPATGDRTARRTATVAPPEPAAVRESAGEGASEAGGAPVAVGDRPTAAALPGSPWQRRLLIAGLVLAALNLRPAITSLGALLEEVRDGLGMSGTVAGMLTSMPALCFAVFGLTAPRLARRWGQEAVVCAGLVAIGLGVLIRPFAGGTVGFLLASALALAGIAVSNILLPVIVKRRFPDRVGPMTGVYTMALALGTSIAAASTVPLTDALGGDWRTGLVLWTVVAALAVLPWFVIVRSSRAARPATPADPAGADGSTLTGGSAGSPGPAGPGGPGGSGEPAREAGNVPAGRGQSAAPGQPAARGRSSGDGDADAGPQATPGRRITRSPTAWALAVFFGLQATGAYITMGWMPQMFRDAGVSASTAGVLLAVTMALGVPLSFVLPRLAARLPHQGGLVVALGACGLVGYAGLWSAPAGGAWAWAVLLGLSNCAFPLALTMIGMRARSSSGVVRLSAFAQSTGYLISIPGPLLVGALYQHTDGWDLPIALMGGLLVLQIGAGVLAGRDRIVENEL
ncbi:MFS transporter [Streptomyces sp. 71268]|uniref:CynX/NimT family MFS transporter n=1 Tax=Streptomyces sp. 71268 TaxID=3002640 RepID=UPI0023F87BD2|nr:MFS transporter [Streptomyces sp. 71268]WEV28514.1 MFS transporter [Streptomyces sp. 71268]